MYSALMSFLARQLYTQTYIPIIINTYLPTNYIVNQRRNSYHDLCFDIMINVMIHKPNKKIGINIMFKGILYINVIFDKLVKLIYMYNIKMM